MSVRPAPRRGRALLAATLAPAALLALGCATLAPPAGDGPQLAIAMRTPLQLGEKQA